MKEFNFIRAYFKYLERNSFHLESFQLSEFYKHPQNDFLGYISFSETSKLPKAPLREANRINFHLVST